MAHPSLWFEECRVENWMRNTFESNYLDTKFLILATLTANLLLIPIKYSLITVSKVGLNSCYSSPSWTSVDLSDPSTRLRNFTSFKEPTTF